MSKQQRDALVQLVLSLNRAEKRHFNLYCRRNASTQDPLFLQLFRLIDRHKRYDEALILERANQIRKSQLPNLRSKLYKEILVALRLLHRNQNEEVSVREHLDFARILYDKGLYRQSLNILDRAKQRAMTLQLHALAMEIISFEKLIESQYITHSIDSTADALAAQSVELAALIHGETTFSNLSLQLYGFYLKNGYARNAQEQEAVRTFFRTHLPEHEEDQLSGMERLYLYQSYVWLYHITQEFARQYRYAQKWVDLFEDHPELLAHNIPLYLKGLHNLLNVLYLTLQYDRFAAVLADLEQFNVDGRYALTANEASLQRLYLFVHRLNKHFLEGTFRDGVSGIDPLVHILESGGHSWDDHRVMVFYYKIACLHFGAGNNSKAIEYLNRIINRVNPNLREDIQSFARILSLIAHYELGNDTLVSYQLRSTYRFLLKMEELNATHDAIFRFLRRTPGMTPDRIRSEFVALKDTLREVQEQEGDMRSGLYLDIISWLESKIQGRSVQEVIQEKFRRRITS
ncbi:MAG: hypothetical protein R3301_10945, partial [Saprospiraceae bacterium]|nr:hypothetical protein [Saprospiraceae bacterium]